METWHFYLSARIYYSVGGTWPHTPVVTSSSRWTRSHAENQWYDPLHAMWRKSTWAAISCMPQQNWQSKQNSRVQSPVPPAPDWIVCSSCFKKKQPDTCLRFRFFLNQISLHHYFAVMWHKSHPLPQHSSPYLSSRRLTVDFALFHLNTQAIVALTVSRDSALWEQTWRSFSLQVDTSFTHWCQVVRNERPPAVVAAGIGVCVVVHACVGHRRRLWMLGW